MRTEETMSSRIVDPNVQIALRAQNEILRFHNDREMKAMRNKTGGGELFHYTSADGLKGIVEDSAIWATSAYYLNDSSEMLYGYSILNTVLDDWLLKHPRSLDSLPRRIALNLRGEFGELLPKGLMFHPIFLACFCEEDNLLSQWRAYGKTGGYSIGISCESEGIAQNLKPEPSVYSARWLKVTYDKIEQESRCRSTLDSLFDILADPKLASAIQEIHDSAVWGYTVLFKLIRDILLEEIVAFKNEAFAVEKEWRIVVRPREVVKQGMDDGGKALIPIMFRTMDGQLIPYVRMVPSGPNEKLPLVSVRSGPTKEETTARLAIRLLLHKHKYDFVKSVEGSKIPVRF